MYTFNERWLWINQVTCDYLAHPIFILRIPLDFSKKWKSAKIKIIPQPWVDHTMIFFHFGYRPGPWRDVHHRGSGGRRLQRAACAHLGESWWRAQAGGWTMAFLIHRYRYTSNYISLYISTITSSHECTYHSTYLQLQVVMHVRTHMIYIYRHTYNTHTYIHEMPCHAITLHCIALRYI